MLKFYPSTVRNELEASHPLELVDVPGHERAARAQLLGFFTVYYSVQIREDDYDIEMAWE